MTTNLSLRVQAVNDIIGAAAGIVGPPQAGIARAIRCAIDFRVNS
jgi:hypothetical protein